MMGENEWQPMVDLHPLPEDINKRYRELMHQKVSICEATMNRYYVSYGYGMSAVKKVLDTEAEVLALRKSLDNPEGDDGYIETLVVIYGHIVEFEPATYVESYRIKETP